MKKSEIVQLALIIFGILIIIRTLETITTQTSIMFGYQDNNKFIASWIFTLIGIVIIMTLIGYLVIRNSKFLSKKIITDKDENENNKSTILNRNEVITISVIILSMFFLITGFLSFISSLFTLLSSFFSDFKSFKEILPGQLWVIIQYVLIILIFMKSNYISNWIERKVMNINEITGHSSKS